MSQSIGWCCVYLKSVKLVLISLINPKGSRGERDVEGGEGRVCMTCCLKKTLVETLHHYKIKSRISLLKSEC